MKTKRVLPVAVAGVALALSGIGGASALAADSPGKGNLAKSTSGDVSVKAWHAYPTYRECFEAMHRWREAGWQTSECEYYPDSGKWAFWAND